MCPVFSSFNPFAGKTRPRATFFSAPARRTFTGAGLISGLARRYVTAFLGRKFLLACAEMA